MLLCSVTKEAFKIILKDFVITNGILNQKVDRIKEPICTLLLLNDLETSNL